MNWLHAAIKDGKVLVAVSGGVDSMCLLVHLHALSRKHSFKIVAGHVDHQVRPESGEDARLVKHVCSQLGVPYRQRTLSAQEGNDEGTLREGRLAALREMAAEESTHVIALGHHRDDMAETFLLMALRGSGPRGLGSMREVAQWPGGFTVIRPLLTMSRAQIKAEMTRNKIPWNEDPTNEQIHHRRNFIRHRILPLLEELEPAALELLARSARLVGEADLHLGEASRKNLATLTLAKSERAILLSIHLMHNIPAHHHGEVIRQAAECLQAHEGATPSLPTHDRLTDLLDTIAGSRSDPATYNLAPGLDAWLGNGYLLLHRDTPVREAFHSVVRGLPVLLAELADPLPVGAIGTTLELPDGITIEVDDGELEPSSDWEAVFSLAKSDSVVDIRNVKPDDIFILPGGGKKNARDSLREARVPAPIRGDVLGVYVDGRLEWIPGVRQSHDTIWDDDPEKHFVGLRILRDGMPI